MPVRFNLDAMLSETQRVVHADGTQVLEGEHRIQIDTGRRLPIHRAILLRGHSKSSVIARQKPAQHGIGWTEFADTRQAEFIDKSVLERAKQSFDTSLRIHGQLHRMVSVRRSVFR
jgi:hypothetical protein